MGNQLRVMPTLLDQFILSERYSNKDSVSNTIMLEQKSKDSISNSDKEDEDPLDDVSSIDRDVTSNMM